MGTGFANLGIMPEGSELPTKQRQFTKLPKLWSMFGGQDAAWPLACQALHGIIRGSI
jgi:hypothetical protein